VEVQSELPLNYAPQPQPLKPPATQATIECQCCFWIAGGLVSYTLILYVTILYVLTLQLFKYIDTKGNWEAQIETPLFECEWAFRIQLYRVVSVLFDVPRYRFISPILTEMLMYQIFLPHPSLLLRGNLYIYINKHLFSH
jgi:hypothetical protein